MQNFDTLQDYDFILTFFNISNNSSQLNLFPSNMFTERFPQIFARDIVIFVQSFMYISFNSLVIVREENYSYLCYLSFTFAVKVEELTLNYFPEIFQIIEPFLISLQLKLTLKSSIKTTRVLKPLALFSMDLVHSLVLLPQYRSCDIMLRIISFRIQWSYSRCHAFFTSKSTEDRFC